jgi:hypothetical protein
VAGQPAVPARQRIFRPGGGAEGYADREAVVRPPQLAGNRGGLPGQPAQLPKYVKCVFYLYGGNPDSATKADPESAPAGFARGAPGGFDGAWGSRGGNFPEKFPGSGPGLGASPGNWSGQAGRAALIFDLPARQ